KNVVLRLAPAAHGRIGRGFRQRCFAESLLHPTEPHEPSVVSSRPGGAGTQVIEREASERGEFQLSNNGERQCPKSSKARPLSSPAGQKGSGWLRQSFSSKRVPMSSSLAVALRNLTRP